MSDPIESQAPDFESGGFSQSSLSDLPSMPQFGSLGSPAANSLGQAFTACRLGAWC